MTLDRHIRIYDPAIDWTPDTGTPIEFATTRDETTMKLRPGKAPIVFHAARLSRSTFRWVIEAASDVERLFRAFRAGVRRVEHPDRTWSPVGIDAAGFVAMTEAECDTYGIADVLEIGGLVYERSTLPTDCEAGYTLRPTSRLVWEASVRRCLRAAPSQDTPRATASEPAASSEG